MKEIDNLIDGASAQLEFLVNRLAAFKEGCFNGFVLPEIKEDDLFSLLTYQAVSILALYTKLPIFIPRKAKKFTYINKDYEYLRPVSSARILFYRLFDKKKACYVEEPVYDNDYDPMPEGAEFFEDIAKYLYQDEEEIGGN